MSRYIDADELKKLVEEEFKGVCVYDVSPDEAIQDFCDVVDNCSSADVAPFVHGQWIYGEDELGQDGYSCSECDFFVPWYYKYYEQGLHFIKDYHLCPQCGAKMDESEENNNE